MNEKIGDVKNFTIASSGVNNLDEPPSSFILNTGVNPEGLPDLSSNGCVVIQQNPGSSNYSVQLAFGFGADKIAIRRKQGATDWTDWKYFTTEEKPTSGIANLAGDYFDSSKSSVTWTKYGKVCVVSYEIVVTKEIAAGREVFVNNLPKSLHVQWVQLFAASTQSIKDVNVYISGSTLGTNWRGVSVGSYNGSFTYITE